MRRLIGACTVALPSTLFMLASACATLPAHREDRGLGTWRLGGVSSDYGKERREDIFLVLVTVPIEL